MQEARAGGAAELRAILDAIKTGADKDALIERLYAATLTGSAEEASILARIGAAKGWARIVTALPKPKPGRPSLRVVGADEGREGPSRPDGLPEGWSDPGGWICARDGVYQIRETPDGGRVPVKVTQRPLWISHRWADVDTGEWSVNVCWPGGQQVVDRKVAVDSKGIVSLASRGAPVGSTSARSAAAWLEASEEQNADAVPVEVSIARLGWTQADGLPVIQTPSGPHLLRAEDGHAQTARALTPAGTWEEWRDLAKEVNAHPIPAIMLAASVGSILLEPCGAPPFVVDLHGLTTTGKTSSLRWAASAWGDPSDGGAYIQPWSATLAAIEGRAGFLRHLPLCMDDTKKVKAEDRGKIGTVVYQWASGQGKSRGRPDGVREVVTWRSIMLSTGEAPLVRLGGEHGGMRLRVLTLDAAPFPERLPLVQRLDMVDTWGHAGARVAAWARQNWGGLRARWEKHRTAAQERLGGAAAAGRMAQYIASIWVGVEALMAVGVPMPALEEMKAMLLASGASALSSSDLASEAWERIGGWLIAKQAQVQGAIWRPSPEMPPAAGWIGRVVGDGDVAVFPAHLEGELRQQGYDPEEVLPQWVTRGWVTADKEGKRRVATRFGGAISRMYRLNLEGWEIAEEPRPPEPPPGEYGEYRKSW